MSSHRLAAVFVAACLIAVGACEREDAAPGEAAGGGAGAAQEGPALVLVQPIGSVTLSDRVRYSGTVAPVGQTMISPKVPGKIETITKRAGDRIAEGEVLVRLDQTDYQLAVRQAKAQLAVAKAAVAQALEGRRSAELPLERVRRLRKSKSVPEAQLDEVESAWRMAGKAVATARAQVQLAEVGLAAAEQQLADTIVHAPYDGFVVKRLVDEGEVSRAMPPTIVLVVVEAPPYYVEGAVNEIEAVRLAEGQELSVHLDAVPDADVRATVTHVNAMVDPETRAVAVRAEVTEGNGHLKVGMSAEVVADLGEQTRLFVPRVAFVEREGDRALVWVVEGDRATRREIRLGHVHRDGFLVTSGLAAGERVVVAGQGAIGPDGAVTVKEDPTIAPRTPEAPSAPVRSADAAAEPASAAGAAEGATR